MARSSVLLIAMTVLALLCFDIPGVLAAMSSTNYQILWDSVGVGGNDTASSTSYQVRSSFGTIEGVGTSASYRVDEGYRAGIYDQVVDFDVFAQSRSSQVAVTVLSGSIVTVTTTAGYAIGDYVALVQDEGASQASKVGKIVATDATTVTVDAWSGGSPVIDGVNDYLYELTGSTIDLGTISSSAVTTSLLGWEVDADVSQGYSVYLFENHNLQSPGGDSLTDVSDGSVTAGSTEYGGISTDSSLATSTFDTQDTAFTTSLQQVASRDGNDFAARDYLTIKASVANGYASGGYSHTLTVIFVGDY